ncbi:hypothetical protein JKP88DRAFT_214302 [Tribonema minus]|uniref:Uncharacterized protein n=1 Tax=Tribonema minus TaxID=303371 RepID=A0A836CPP3_9STRA|nr:hypothetical protein JKP88DRAFT_214302 [Tribonema minus]
MLLLLLVLQLLLLLSSAAHMPSTASRRAWLQRAASGATATAATVAAPAWLQPASVSAAEAGAGGAAEPVLQVLVQLEEGKQLGGTQGAMMYVTASENEGGKPLVGAKVALDKAPLPAMLQLYPVNMLQGRSWESVPKSTLTISVQIYAGGSGPGSGTPVLAGTGISKYLASFGDIITTPQWLPAYVVLQPNGALTQQ